MPGVPGFAAVPCPGRFEMTGGDHSVPRGAHNRPRWVPHVPVAHRGAQQHQGGSVPADFMTRHPVPPACDTQVSDLARYGVMRLLLTFG